MVSPSGRSLATNRVVWPGQAAVSSTVSDEKPCPSGTPMSVSSRPSASKRRASHGPDGDLEGTSGRVGKGEGAAFHGSGAGPQLVVVLVPPQVLGCTCGVVPHPHRAGEIARLVTAFLADGEDGVIGELHGGVVPQ